MLKLQVGSSKVRAFESTIRAVAVAQPIVNDSTVNLQLNNEATVNNVVKHLNLQTNSLKNCYNQPKPLSHSAGPNMVGTLSAAHRKNANTFWRHWTKLFIKTCLVSKRRPPINIPEVGSVVLVVDVLQPRDKWCLG